MNCFFCRGDMTDGITTHVADIGSCVIIVRNVPCHKCKQCGEVSYCLEVAERLEQIVNMLKNTLVEVTIVKYSDEVA